MHGLICFLLYILLFRTIFGVRVRAGTEDSEMASALGMNTKVLGTTVFAIGCGLAAIAGVVSGPFLSLSPSMGGSIIITTFIVVVIGRMHKFAHVVVSALIIGFVDSLGSILIPDFTMILVYVVMIVVLMNNHRLSDRLKLGRTFQKWFAKEG